jgi:hypothetical protein
MEFETDFSSELKKLPSNFVEPSWNLSRIDAFKIATEQEFTANFPWKNKIEWDFFRGDLGKKMLKLTVKIPIFGVISTELNLSYIHDLNCPKNLPYQLRIAFEKRFIRKIDKIEKELTKQKQQTQQPKKRKTKNENTDANNGIDSIQD